MKFFLRFFLALLQLGVLLAWPGFSAAQTPAPAAASATALHLGVLAFRDLASTRQRWEPTRAALQAAMPGYHLHLHVLHQPELDAQVATGQLDFVFTQPEHYVLLRSQHGLAALATLIALEAGRPVNQFGGVLLVRSGHHAIQILADVRGQRVLGVIPTSLGAFRMQQWALLQQGVRLPQDVASLNFSGQPQDRVPLALLRGEADVGFVRTGVLERMERSGAIPKGALRALPPAQPQPFPVALSTELFPEWPLSATRRASTEASTALTLALLKIKPDSAAARAGEYFGFAPPSDYTPLEAMLIRLGAYPGVLPELSWRDLVRERPLTVAGSLLALLLLAVAAALGFWWLGQRRQALERERSLLLRSLGEGVLGLDAQGRCTFVNSAALRLLALEQQQLLGRTVAHCFAWPAAQAQADTDPIMLTLGDGQERSLRAQLRAGAQPGVAVSVRLHPMQQGAQRVGAVLVFADISASLRHESDLRLAATALETLEGICITDRDNRIVRVNRAFTEVTGYSQDEALGQTPALLASGLHDAAFYRQMWQQLLAKGRWQGEIWNRRKSGEIYPEWLSVAVVRADDGSITHHVGTFLDLSQRKQAEAQILHLSLQDALTGLLNRQSWLERLWQALREPSPSGQHAGVLCLDLDDFKRLNDAVGHAAGDALLQEVARRLPLCLGPQGYWARLGGDEFALLWLGLPTAASEAAALMQHGADKLRQALNQPYNVNGQRWHTSASMGAVLLPLLPLASASAAAGSVALLEPDLLAPAQERAAECMRHAELAMYQAKAAGGNQLRFFDADMQQQAEQRAWIETELRQALAQGGLALHYQRQCDAHGQTLGAEALLRWQHLERGPIAPGVFIPVAERCGLMLELGRWVLQSACTELACWQRQAQRQHWCMAVNVSVRQFQDPGFEADVARIVAASGIRAQGLKLEITESLLLDDLDATLGCMQRLRRLGLSFALDDFGTGYASLAYLQRLCVDQIKIDASFVRDLPQDTGDAAIASAIIGMGHSLGLQVVAEGVETREQRDWLAARGCDAFQGYYYARPVPTQELPG